MPGEWKGPRVQEKFPLKQHNYFKVDTSASKLQKPKNKQNKIIKKINRTVKLCTPASKLTCH